MKPYYQDKWVTIYHGDCREILPQLDVKVDLVLTDPPYIVGAKGCGLAGDRQYLHDITRQELDCGFDINILKHYRDWFCFCGKQQLPALIDLAQSGNWMLIVWCKTNPTPLTNNNYLPDCEYIVHKYSSGHLYGNYCHKSRFYLSSNMQGEGGHPTIKPIGLVMKLITLGSLSGDTILDPFLGSGTTCYCAKKLNRYSIGIEIEEKYCEIAAKRCMQEVMDFSG